VKKSIVQKNEQKCLKVAPTTIAKQNSLKCIHKVLVRAGITFLFELRLQQEYWTLPYAGHHCTSSLGEIEEKAN